MPSPKGCGIVSSETREERLESCQANVTEAPALSVGNKAPVSAEDRMRADLYNYLGLILAAPPDQLLIDQTAGLEGDDTEFGGGKAVLALSRHSRTRLSSARQATIRPQCPSWRPRWN